MLHCLLLLLLSTFSNAVIRHIFASPAVIPRIREIVIHDGSPNPVFRSPFAGMGGRMISLLTDDQDNGNPPSFAELRVPRPTAEQNRLPFHDASSATSMFHVEQPTAIVIPTVTATPLFDTHNIIVTPVPSTTVSTIVQTTAPMIIPTSTQSTRPTTLNDHFHRVFTQWIRIYSTKKPKHPDATFSGKAITSTTIYPDVSTKSFPYLPSPPSIEFVDPSVVFTTMKPRHTVFDPRMPTIVEGWPLGKSTIEKNPLIDETDDNNRPPSDWKTMLQHCPIYPEAKTIYIHQIVIREYSTLFDDIRTKCDCGDGSHEAFYARGRNIRIPADLISLDPSFLKSELVIGRFGCAYPGNLCIRTEDGKELRSIDWTSHVYPAVPTGEGWAHTYILLMENNTILENVENGKIYLGSSQFIAEKRKTRLEHSYLRIKSISCDGCRHPRTCQPY